VTDGEHPANGPHTRTVEAGYDRVAEAYLSTKNPEDPVTLAVLEDLASDLPSTAAVLDLGCGAGIPVTRWLAHRGYAVTGVDVSARQLELVRKYVPEATFIKADMIDLALGPETFDAVVAFHSIIHVPAKSIRRCLPPSIAGWGRAEYYWRPSPSRSSRARTAIGRDGGRDAVEPPRRGDQPQDVA